MAAPPHHSPRSESRLDSKLLLRALIELNIARKNMMNYPEGHHQVGASSRRAFQHLRALLDQGSEISIGVVREGLLIADQPLEAGNSVIKDLSSALRDRRVARVEIDAGLSLEDTLSFLRLINGAPEGMPPGPAQAENAPKSLLLNSIRVQFIDYSLFHHTDDLAAAGLPAASDPDAPKSIWHDYVRLLGSGVLTNSAAGTPIAGGPEPTPEEIAQYVNLQAKTDPNLVRSYEQVIQDHLQRAAARPLLSESKHGAQKRFKQFIENLNPNLRKQFLSIAFDHFQKHAEQTSAEGVLNDLHYSIVIEMLTQANADGKEISPSLLNFLRKLDGSCALRDMATSQAESAGHLEELKRLLSILPNGGVMRRETYEAYVNPDYDRTLQALIPNQRGAVGADSPPFDTGPHLESLSERSVTLRLGQAFLSLLKKESHPGVYREHALNLMAIVEDLAGFGGDDLLLEILQLFRAHSDGSRPAPIDAAARHCHEQLRSPRFINTVLDPICQHGHPTNAVQLELLIGLGPGVAAEVLSRYLTRRNPVLKELLKKVAAAFPQRVSADLAHRLHNADPEEFVALQAVVVLLSPERIESLLHPFLDHKDRRIHLTALTVLVRYKHDGALHRLESLLESRDPVVLKVATGLIEKCTLREMVPILIRILGRGFLLFKADLDKTEKIIAAIHRIASPAPRKELERALRWKVSIHPRRLKRIKASLKALPEDRAVQTACAALHSPSKCAGL